MKSSDKPIIIGASLFLLLFGIVGFFLWVVVSLIIIVMPASKPRPKINRLSNVSNTNTEDTLIRLKLELETKAAAESDPQVAVGLLRAAALLQQESEVAAPVVVNTPALVNVPEPAPTPPPHEPLDQIVLMLYVGAFLLLGGMSLFIVYGGLTDIFRLVLIAVMALLMYGVGLALFGARQTLRPAGVAFLGIGLVMIPLTGYAAVYLTHSDPYGTWFLTSIIGLVAYSYALVTTKAEVVGYMVFLMWLSLAQSAITLFGGTVRWFAWVSLIVAIATQLLLPMIKKYIGPELTFPFWVSSLILVPIAVCASLLQVITGDMELWQLGVSLALGGIYCLSSLYILRSYEGSIVSPSAYGTSAHIFLLLSLLVFTYDIVTNGWEFGYVLLILATAHMVGWSIIRMRLSRFVGKNYDWLLFILTIVLSFASWIWFAKDPWLLVTAAIVTTLLSVVLTYESKRQESALFATLAMFALPPFVAQATVGFSGDERYIAVLTVGYLLLALLLAGARVVVRSNRQIALFPLVGYVVATAIAWVSSLGLGSDTFFVQAGVMITALVITITASYYERVPYAMGFAQLVLFGIFYAVLEHYTALSSREIIAWAAIVTAAVSYMYSLVAQGERGLTLLIASMVTMGIAWFTSSSLSNEMWNYLSPCIGFWLAALLYVEKPRLKGGVYFALLPAFVGLLAVVQLLDILMPDLHFLIYSHLWAGYGAYVWYVLAKNGATKDSVELAMYITLLIFTAPLVLMALSEGSYYSLLLLIQQSILLTLGMLLQIRVLSIWAAVTIVGVVVYALRSFGYLQLVVIALLLIGYAFYRLLNQQDRP